MQNKEIKREMLKNGQYANLRAIDRLNYRENGKSFIGLIHEEMYKSDNIGFFDFMEKKEIKERTIQDLAKEYKVTAEELRSYIQMTIARKQQSIRLRDHIEYLFKKKYVLVFATFTFNDQAMSLKQDTRKQKVSRSINECPSVTDYIANIDYGKENEREHYHAIIALKDFEPTTKRVKVKDSYQRVITNMPINYDYGFTTYELIGSTEDDRSKVKNYVTKLGLHALKVKQKRIIMKRDSEYHLHQKKVKEDKISYLQCHPYQVEGDENDSDLE